MFDPGRFGRALRRLPCVTVCCASVAFAQVTWTVRYPTPQVDLHAAIWTGNLLAVAGESGALFTSSDAVAWTASSSGTTMSILGLAGNNNLIIAVGPSGALRTATPGNPGTWTSRTSGTANALHAAAINGNTLSLAVGAAGTIVTSTNGTSGWTSRTSGTTQTLRAVEYGNNLYVAAGEGGTLLTSINGTGGWTSRASGTTLALHRVRWADNLWVAVGSAGTILTSSNGTSGWTARVSATAADLRGLQRGANLWVAVGDSGRILTSTNGTSWTARNSGTGANLLDVTWTGGQFLAVGANGLMLSSADGIDWAPVLYSSREDLHDLVWNGSQYVAVGAAGAVLTSTNGNFWTTRPFSASISLNAVDTGAGLFVVLGDSGRIFTSTNGTTWTTRASGTTRNLNALRRGGGRFVAVGEGGVILLSPNGTTWAAQVSGTTQALHAVEWTGTQFLAAGAGGTVLASPDGSAWASRASGTTATLHALRVTDARVAAAGAGGLVLLSQDGGAWEAQTPVTAFDLRSLAWLGDRLVAVGTGGVVISSPNGVTWTLHATGLTANLDAVVRGGVQIAAVGEDGLILTAPGAPATAAPPVPSLVSPAQNATGVASNPTLQWTTSGSTGAGGNTYRVQLSTRPDFATLVADDSTRIGNILTVSNLQANTAHYWRVRSKSPGAAGNSSFWSGTGTFSTGSLAAPVIDVPVNGAANVTEELVLSWTTVAGATSYHAQVSTAPSFAANLLDDSGLTATTRAVPGLAPNTVYYCRVAARGASGASAWSAVHVFTTAATAPAAPSLNAPAQNATGVSIYNGALSWFGVSGATSYRAQLALDSGFASLLLDDSLLTGESRGLATLAGGTVHYWRMRARNLAGSGPWSVVRRFTTAPAPTGPPSAPTLLAPAQFATNEGPNPNLTWAAVEAASHYHVQLSLSADFATLVAQDSTLTVARRSGFFLQGTTDYFWRVRCRNPFGAGPWSETRTFRTGELAPTVAPILVAPEQFASAVSIPAALSWQSVQGATSYRAQVSTAADFSVLAFESANAAGTAVATGALAAHTDYYWRVAARNSRGTGPYSTIRRFTTGSLPAPEAPVLLTPAEFETGVIQGRVLSWTSVAIATSYRVQVSPSATFATPVLDDSTVTAASRALVAALQPLTIYYWRVLARNAVGASPWSTPRSFTTAAQLPSALLDGPRITRVQGARGGLMRIELPTAERVGVRLLDLRGRITAVLLDETLPAGRHELEVPGEGAGLRVLDFRAGDFRRSVILKPDSF